MGIIIIPFLIGILIIAIVAIFKTVKLIKSKAITNKDIGIGFIISLSLFGLISILYIIEGKAWALSPAFRIPFFMIFMPFVTHLLTQKNEKEQTEYISKLLLISVAITSILVVVSYPILIDLVKYLGVETYY